MKLNETIRINYKNYRGELSTRHIIPKALKFEKTEWHDEQWILYAFDVEKDDYRGFALLDIEFLKD